MQQLNLGKFSIALPGSRWAIGLGLATIMLSSASVIYLTRTQPNPNSIASEKSLIQLKKVTALGRLEPQGEVIRISEPSGQGGAYRVDQLLVKVGDRVESGQVIAILDSFDRWQGAFREAEEQVKVAQAKLNQVKAGAQQGDIAAQQATIARLEAQLAGEISTQQATVARLEAELQNAQVEAQRHQDLYQNGVISASLLDSKSLAAQTAQQQVNEARANLDRSVQTLKRQIQEARATLNRIVEVRPTDVAAAQAEVDRAIATANKTKAEFDEAYVRAPKAGRILRVYTQAGEAVSPDGIVDLGQTDQMYAVAEVYEGDINNVKVGQSAVITADTLPGEIKGTVEQIGWTIAKQDLLDTDPTAAADARVIEVKIRLDKTASQKVAQLTNLQVDVDILL